MKRYKSKFEEGYKDFGKLSQWYSGNEYDNYDYGNPKEAAKNIWADTLEYLKNIEKNLDLAGDSLAPGIKVALLKTLKGNIEAIKV